MQAGPAQIGGCGRSRRNPILLALAGCPAAGAALDVATASPDVDKTASFALASTVVPSGAVISTKVPAAGAGTSSTTLSVSRSTRFSSRDTASPAFLCHATNVASLTDSGNCGTLISIVISCFDQPLSVSRTCSPWTQYQALLQAKPAVVVNVL